mgnify:CR=1 FL=1
MWRDGEGKQRTGPNHQIWALIYGGHREADHGLRLMTSLDGRCARPTRRGRLILSAVRLVQEFGTIDGPLVFEVATPTQRGARWRRSNSMRRSNAVERIIG